MKGIRARLFGWFLPDREAYREPARDSARRRAAWLDFLVMDFAILRVFWKNFGRVGLRGQAVRMNQPFPADIRKAAAHGVRTIVTARHDPRHGGNALVAAECEVLGLDYRTFPGLYSRMAPSRETLLVAPSFFAELRYPVLLHCKSGADRAGFLSALYLIVVEGRPVREAKDELSLRYLHFSTSKTGILDAVFAAYLAAHPDEDKPFLDWVRDDYDPEALTAGFRAEGAADFLDRVILRRE